MILCFDVGGTSIKCGLAEEKQNNIVFSQVCEIKSDAKTLGGAGIENKIKNQTDYFCKNFSVKAVAICTAGMVDHITGKIIYANENIPDYTGRNLKQMINSEFSLPCIVENDVNAAALGETFYGSARKANSILCLTIGTGIGGALIIDKKIWHGHNASAGEVGYMHFEKDTYENQASTTALIKNVKNLTGKELSGKQIFSEAKSGNIYCIKAIDDLCNSLIKGIANILYIVDTEMVVLGGGIMAQHEYLKSFIDKYWNKYLSPIHRKNTSIAFAQLGNYAGMAGAFVKLRQSM